MQRRGEHAEVIDRILQLRRFLLDALRGVNPAVRCELFESPVEVVVVAAVVCARGG